MKQPAGKTALATNGTAAERGAAPVRGAPPRNGQHQLSGNSSAVARHAKVWAHMDQLALRATALWPKGLSAADAVSRSRRGA